MPDTKDAKRATINGYEPHPIDTSSIDLRPEFEPIVEEAAKAEHEMYVKGRQAEGVTNENTVPWDELTEEQKDSSRNGISEAMKVMQLKGYSFEPSSDSTAPLTEEQKSEIDDIVAHNAHEVWAVERLAQGWDYGEEKDNKAKTNPTLVPYENLKESETEYDRNFARGVTEAITNAGYSIVPPVREQDRNMPSHNNEWISLCYRVLNGENKLRDGSPDCPKWDETTISTMVNKALTNLDKVYQGKPERVTRVYENKNSQLFGRTNLVLSVLHPDWGTDKVMEQTKVVVKAMREPVAKQIEDAGNNQKGKDSEKGGPQRSGPAKSSPEQPKKPKHNNTDPEH